MPVERELETYLTLLLAEQNPALAAAHDELYPERVPEGIPLSLTLLYPFAPRAEVDRHRETLRSFFASHAPFELQLARLEQWEESGAVYAAPDPEQPVRDLMRALWRLFPQFPPYGERGGDPPPHASLTYTGGDDRAATRARVERRLEQLLPARFHIRDVALMEEAEPDRWRLRDTFRLGT
ncbi:MAG: 2'-5' RNA ligase family protein [Actinomycetota bacterium]|nr:2'-5' RNA ligase family protein [Actinomycetota bacterium]